MNILILQVISATYALNLTKKVGVLVYGCNLIPCNTKLTLYKSAILSHLTYWLLAWNFCKSYNSRKIVQVQEGALHAIYISKMETYKELLAHARLPTLNNRHLQHNATLMYKVKNNLVPSCLSQLFKTKTLPYCLRNWDFEIPCFNATGYGRHTIRY